MTREPLVCRNSWNPWLLWTGQILQTNGTFKVPDFGQIKSYRGFSTTIRTGILRSFFWEGSQVGRKPSLEQIFKKKIETVCRKTRFRYGFGLLWDRFGVNWERFGVNCDRFWIILGTFWGRSGRFQFQSGSGSIPQNRKSVPAHLVRFLRPVPPVPVPKRFGFRFPVRFGGFL